MGTKTNMGTETELVNTRNNAAATSIPNKINIKIGMPTSISW